MEPVIKTLDPTLAALSSKACAARMTAAKLTCDALRGSVSALRKVLKEAEDKLRQGEQDYENSRCSFIEACEAEHGLRPQPKL